MLPGQLKIRTTAENILVTWQSVKRTKTSRAQNGFVAILFPTKIRPFDRIVASQVHRNRSIGPMKVF